MNIRMGFASRAAVVAAALCAGAALAAAQQSAATPALTFDVVSIKAAPDIATVIASHQVPHFGTRIDAGRVDIGFVSLQDLICTAYDVKPYQVSGPDWINRERFDILATLPEGASKDQVPQMLQALLAERFHLVVHRDNHTQPIYALVVAPGGSQLAPAATTPPAPPPEGRGTVSVDTGDGKVTVTPGRSSSGATTASISGGKAGPMQITMEAGEMQLQAAAATMPTFADMLSQMVDRPVLDLTGLSGAYQIKLVISKDDIAAMQRAAMLKMGMPAPPVPAGEASAPAGASIFASVQKLGLKLEARDAPVGRVVVDSADKVPTAN